MTLDCQADGLRSRRLGTWARALACGIALAVAPAAARAELGGRYASVMADSVQLRARVKSVPATNYTVHQMSLANGGEVRQFAAADGTVFAVAWNGPGRPDLRQLLGPRFDVVQAANAPAPGHFRRHALSVQHPDFVVQTGGHPGAFFGVAYLPQALPAGVTGSEIH